MSIKILSCISFGTKIGPKDQGTKRVPPVMPWDEYKENIGSMCGIKDEVIGISF